MSRLNVHDFEREAQSCLSQGLFDFVAGGALAETTLNNNRTAFDDLKLHYRVLKGITAVDLTTELFGQTLSMPVITAPTGSQALVHPEGELAVRRATAAANTIMTVATTATFSMAQIKGAAAGPLWFQLYLFKDRGLNKEITARVTALGYDAIALTVDAPVFGIRERDARNRYVLPAGLSYENLPVPEATGRDVAEFMNENWKSDLDWTDVAWLRDQTELPILLKGIAHPDDAEMGLNHGLDGIWVSNHGGRQLDGAAGTLEVLPDIARRLAGRIPIICDGGIRRGTDIIKALALGATAVAIGRPMLWGLAVAGETGVRKVLDILRAELENGLMLCGCPSLKEISGELIFSPGGIDG